jgi:phage shock protein B
MMGPGEMTILLVFGIPIIAIIGGVLITIVKILKSDGRGNDQLSAEEAKILQELQRGLDRMERRVEALETILTEHNRRR